MNTITNHRSSISSVIFGRSTFIAVLWLPAFITAVFILPASFEFIREIDRLEQCPLLIRVLIPFMPLGRYGVASGVVFMATLNILINRYVLKRFPSSIPIRDTSLVASFFAAGTALFLVTWPSVLQILKQILKQID